jgi:hypothetical protein
MTRAMLVSGLAVLVLGCGSGDGPLANTQWSLTQGSCSLAATFGTEDNYSLVLGCPLDSGQLAVQEEVGLYSATDTQLITTPTKTTCANATRETDTYNVSATALIIQTSSSLLVFTKAQPTSGGSGVLELGCFDSNGTFTPGPLHSL